MPGYYLHIEPADESILGSGLYMPDKPVLQALRNDFVAPKSRDQGLTPKQHLYVPSRATRWIWLTI